MIEQLKAQLVRHEGDIRYPYKCSAGHLTIGIGHNLEAKPLSDYITMALLEEDINDCINDITKNFLWYHNLDDPRKAVIINMVFNLGISRFMKFKKTIKCLEQGDYKGAAFEMLNSKWADQVGQRAVELSSQMETGEW